MIPWLKRWLPIAALIITLLAVLDPLEGFPLVLIGGVLTLMAALQEQAARVTLATWGLGLAVLGCGAMVGLSALGGVGGTTGRSLWWLLLIAPYPMGVVCVAAANVLILRARNAKPNAHGRG